VDIDKRCLTSMVARVNEDWARIYSWSLENSLVLNPRKTQSNVNGYPLVGLQLMLNGVAFGAEWRKD
jgi:hypothetical protein